jgi:hypothetical protein
LTNINYNILKDLNLIDYETNHWGVYNDKKQNGNSW